MEQTSSGGGRPVVATEGMLRALRDTRPWALACASLLIAHAAVGLLWLTDLVARLISGPVPSRPFITAASVNLLFAPVALVGGWLAVGYFSSAVSACRRRGPEDLERAGLALKRLRLWAGAAAIVLVVFLACMAVAAVLTGEFPG